MPSIKEKYARFLITDEMKEIFQRFSSSQYPNKEVNEKVIIETTETKDGIAHVISKDIQHAKLV